MGGEEQKREHVEKCSATSCREERLGDRRGGKDMGRNRRRGRTEEILQNKGGRRSEEKVGWYE